MTRIPTPLTPEEAALERDPSFRKEAMDEVLDEAKARGIRIDQRCRRLIQQYVDGQITCDELDRELVRPILH
ncbi:hypothetical protein LDO32_03825 [Luteimonas sp. Y-2-2-4F]|nr:hypothetical protein [Luteimonas sp. Y-2-2-4F]MCD9030863.1 hypothetical protein [Luteimonas sp. Y-2-2-4F]